MSDPVWQRLGEALQRRRVELDPKYRNLALFARERGLNERLVSDIEHGRRSGYRKGTRHALEIAYGLDAGRIDRFIAGEAAGLAPPPAALPISPPAPEPRFADPRLQYVMDTPGLDLESRLVLVDITRAIIARREAGNRSA
jgi:hypothetical protein